MVVCDLEPDGSAPWELLRKYGGKFRFFEKLRKGGVGSPKIVYHSGVEEIDEFVEETAGSDIPYLNFECLRKGLLVRVNKTQYLKGLVISYDEILSIEMQSIQELKKDALNPMVTRKKNLGGGKLKIKSSEGQVLICGVTVQAYDGLRKFFNKNKILQEKFNSNIIT